MADTNSSAGRYGQRPVWQWVVIYLVIGGLIYALLYLYSGRNGRYSGTVGQAPPPTSTPLASAMPVTPTPVETAAPLTVIEASGSATPMGNNIYTLKMDVNKGQYLADFAGVALYTYTQDKSGQSNCTGTCAATWPPYTSGAVAQSNFPSNISALTRPDGSKQFAWKGKPLYYYINDTAPGQITGDGVDGFQLAK